MIRNPKIAALAVCTLALAFVQSQAQAQVVPFKVTGGGIAPDGVPSNPGQSLPHWAIGNATELGKYYGQGFVELDMFTGPNTATFSSPVPFVFTAANGDNLAFYYGRVDQGATSPGEVTLYPAGGGEVIAVFVAEFTPAFAACTGQFTKLSGGSFTMVAISEPFVFGSDAPAGYTWSGQGTLEFSRGK
jgi:hypothetical protein